MSKILDDRGIPGQGCCYRKQTTGAAGTYIDLQAKLADEEVWKPLRHGHLLSSKGEGLEELHSRSMLVIGEKSGDLKPAFVFFTKQQKGVWGLRNRRKQGLRPMAPNPVFEMRD